MLRRHFMTLVSECAALFVPLWRAARAVEAYWPFEEIDWLTFDDLHDASCPSKGLDDHCLCRVHWRHCDICDESYMEDVWVNRPIRKFYKATDGGGCIVCERCTEAYLKGE